MTTVLAVHDWGRVTGGYSNAGLLAFATIDRFENGSWAPTAQLDFSPAVVIDLGEGSLLVHWVRWQRVVPAAGR